MLNSRDMRDLQRLRHALGLSDPAFEQALRRAAGVTDATLLRSKDVPAVAQELGRLARRSPPMITSLALSEHRRRT